MIRCFLALAVVLITAEKCLFVEVQCSDEANSNDTDDESNLEASKNIVEQNIGADIEDGNNLFQDDLEENQNSDDESNSNLEASSTQINNTSANTTATANTTAGNRVSKRKLNCLQKNISEPAIGSVEIINVTTLLKFLASSNKSYDQYSSSISTSSTKCALVLFYASWCSFSAALAPHYNALGRIYSNFDIFAIDAGKHSSLNARYGIVGVPSVVVFSNKRLVAKMNNTEANVQDLANFLKFHTGLDAIGKIEVISKDFEGPLPCFVTHETDYMLVLAWVFCMICSVYGFIKSSLCRWIVEAVKVNWREAEAQHEHVD